MTENLEHILFLKYITKFVFHLDDIQILSNVSDIAFNLCNTSFHIVFCFHIVFGKSTEAIISL